MAGQALILKNYNKVDIPLRLGDRYVNATAMCKACEKRWADYWRLRQTQEFAVALASDVGIPTSLLVESRKGNSPEFPQGTWVHPQIALNLAGWLSATFAVQVGRWLEELLTKGAVALPGHEGTLHLPRPWSLRLSRTFKDHQRYINGSHPGWWSILTAVIAAMLTIEDELLQCALPVNISDRPDGSIGKRWANARRARGLPDATLTAPLFLPGENGAQGRKVHPLIYSPDERGEFEKWFYENYMPNHLPDYLHKKFQPLGPEARLPAASAANQSCVEVTGKPAKLTLKESDQLKRIKGPVIYKPMPLLPFAEEGQ